MSDTISDGSKKDKKEKKIKKPNRHAETTIIVNTF
jgi:hypothetical protein